MFVQQDLSKMKYFGFRKKILEATETWFDFGDLNRKYEKLITQTPGDYVYLIQKVPSVAIEVMFFYLREQMMNNWFTIVFKNKGNNQLWVELGLLEKLSEESEGFDRGTIQNRYEEFHFLNGLERQLFSQLGNVKIQASFVRKDILAKIRRPERKRGYNDHGSLRQRINLGTEAPLEYLREAEDFDNLRLTISSTKLTETLQEYLVGESLRLSERYAIELLNRNPDDYEIDSNLNLVERRKKK